jgi:phosphoglycerate kinase
LSFTKKTLKDIVVKNKTVLVSVDYNVPGDAHGNPTDDYRIKNSLPTIEYLLAQHCRIVLMSHRGRPEGRVMSEFSLGPVAHRLQRLVDVPVHFAEDCVGPKAETAKQQLQPKQILVLENTRFHPEEEADDATFGKQLAAGADVFVQDAFGNAHRKHASTDAVTKYLPSVAGLLVAKEVDTISRVMEQPERPLMAIIGGAKIADKIDVLNKFIELADIVAVGGAMANTFLLAERISIGKSKADKSEVPLARQIIAKARDMAKRRHFVFYLPQDGVAALNIASNAHTRIVDWDAHVIAEIENYPKKPSRLASEVLPDEILLDIGPFSGAFIAGSMQLANTVVWNGTMGVTETPALNGPVGPFAHGTELIVDAMLGEHGHKPYTLVGGGDTAAYIDERGLLEHFNHVSTGGGASLELMSGNKLPAVEALADKSAVKKSVAKPSAKTIVKKPVTKKTVKKTMSKPKAKLKSGKLKP